jgi:nicotinamide riboside transporter PnuC
MLGSIETLSAIYVVLSIVATVQTLRKRRSAFVIGLVSQIFMVAIIAIDPKLFWFAIQTIIYGAVNVAGLFSKNWKKDPWW